MDDHDHDEKRKTPSDRYANVDIGGLPPIGPDGIPAFGAMGAPPPLPDATPENFVCLRGPCRHYWEMSTHMSAGNTASTFGPDGLRDESGQPLRPPRSILRTCLVHPGTETDLGDECVFECNRWDPIEDRVIKDIGKRRKAFYKRHPHIEEKNNG